MIILCIIQIKGDKPSKVVEFAKSKLKCGYVWGATGQILTERNLKRFLLNGHVEEKRVRKWLNKQVYDCAGLVMRAFETVGIQIKSGATSAWRGTSWQYSGTIKSLPKDKVCILYREGEGKMQHTGIYIGNNYFIHAKGSDYGVVQESMAKSRWTHWGIPKNFYDKDDVKISTSFPCQAKVVATSGNTVRLRKSPSTSSDVLVNIKLGTIVTLTGEENGWCSVTYGSKTGYMMSQFLEKI